MLPGKLGNAIGLISGLVIAAWAVADQPIEVVTDGNNGWVVSPTGSDDTGNLQWAFDNVGPGGVVQLTAGDFYTSEIVECYVENLAGFKGSGLGVTNIHGTPGVEFDQVSKIAYFQIGELIIPFGGTFLFEFVSAEATEAQCFTISDLSLFIDTVSEEWDFFGSPANFRSGFDIEPAGESLDLNLTVERVEVIGSTGDEYYSALGNGVSCFIGINVNGITGRFEYGGYRELEINRNLVRNCIWSIRGEGFRDTSINVSRNRVRNSSMAILFFDSGTDMCVYRNDIRDCVEGVYVDVYDPATRSKVVAMHNSMKNVVYGVDLQNMTEGSTLTAVLAHNRIRLKASGSSGGGAILFGKVDDGAVFCNRINGRTYDSAVKISGEANKIVANNVRGLKSNTSQPPVWLLPEASGTIVMWSGEVLDEGTDNILIGAR